MPNPISDETVDRIRKALVLDLNDITGSLFAEVGKTTFQKWRRKLGLQSPTNQYREPESPREDISDQLRRIRIKEGIEGLGSRQVKKNHPGTYYHTLEHFKDGYSGAFEYTFGFPFSRAAINLAVYIQDLNENGEEINLTVLAGDNANFRRLLRQGQFDLIRQFATTNPVIRKRTKREVHDVLGRMVLRYLPTPNSYITSEMKNAFPPQYRIESGDLLAYARHLGLIIPSRTNGVTTYQASDSTIPKVRKILENTLEDKLDQDEELDISPFAIWWNSLEAGSGEGDYLRYIEKTLEGLLDEDIISMRSYFAQALCNPDNYDNTKNTFRSAPPFRRAAIVSDAIVKFNGENGIPIEFYKTLGLLPLEDERTAKVFGELLGKKMPREKGLEFFVQASMQKDPESVYRMARDYGIFVGYRV